uniref:Uncharacterized protein n=1 Tax=Candidatus Kentrum sp. TC TaxID=2126339 RepID=A0A450ZMD5_9GAMM|nr:MAG: hypothetical protein BECKTC1821F_GA0114240_100615 [Candidatus Kentron sp. TC]
MRFPLAIIPKQGSKQGRIQSRQYPDTRSPQDPFTVKPKSRKPVSRAFTEPNGVVEAIDNQSYGGHQQGRRHRATLPGEEIVGSASRGRIHDLDADALFVTGAEYGSGRKPLFFPAAE